jgi:hypothetical protein
LNIHKEIENLKENLKGSNDSKKSEEVIKRAFETSKKIIA